ncbi:hypothetical protein ACFCT7_04315 [Fulvivirgaceae bacterium LMO-SS25]
MSKKTISVKAKASKKGDATSGKIIVNSKGHHMVIKAVVFTAKQSSQISEAVEKAYTIANSVYKK